MVKFCIDKIIDNEPYPNLGRLDARPYTDLWKAFSVTWPYSEPVHFLKYLDRCKIDYSLVNWTQSDRSTLYPISLSFFDYSIDWFDLLPSHIKDKLRSRSITIWFFYSEGDNPYRIKDHLIKQFLGHHIGADLIQFVSANSAAKKINGFHHFVDDEFLYQLRNNDLSLPFHNLPRSRKFTALVRTHKWWRASVMAKIYHQDMHTQAYFSYNNKLSTNEHWRESPVDIMYEIGLYDKIQNFLSMCPFTADSLTSDQHNHYGTTVKEHFTDSYLHLILETHFDTEQSGGVFLTEKTFKPIKNAQPFLIFGCRGSVDLLRDMGYRTFDHVIDHSYDNIENNTMRWLRCYKEFERLMASDLHQIYVSCKSDLEHNQDLFCQQKKYRLNNLLTQSIIYATQS